ncbi:hypothetical protein [Methylobacterium soli]|uniref:Uncharacterized protein n=1 Tax=Methylobacterium soli TaxID=553447 RepID=A0A6L3SVL2_9HYPH|nr:hypothetical protein [Methylobacterium soli]KAB1075825.1 hypothetical protein F6X53_24400 [Methylobacterium soli]GJE45765.1 hypothetical protein AEGHOMDF_4965 [Methylobacterium soli]
MADNYWRSVHKRALKDTRSALALESTERLVITIILAVLAICLLWLVGGPSEAGGELATKAAGSAAILLFFPLVYLWRIFKTPSLLSMELKEIARALEERLRIISEKQGIKSPSFDIIALRSGINIQFDCSKAQNFYYTQTEISPVLVKPENPSEGIYRLYVVSGANGISQFSVSNFYKWSFLNDMREFKKGNIIIYEINILKVDGEYTAFGYPIYYSGARTTTIFVLGSRIDPSSSRPCARRRSISLQAEDPDTVEFDNDKDRSGEIFIDVPRDYWYGKFRFRIRAIRFVREQTPVNAAVFSLCCIGSHNISDKQCVRTKLVMEATWFCSPDWSEVSEGPIGFPGSNRFVLTRHPNDPEDTWPHEIILDSLEIEINSRDF